MVNSLVTNIENELENNVVFKKVFKNFKIPKLDMLEKNTDLVYKSNEYMGYYKKEVYFDLIPQEKISSVRGTLKLTLTSSVKEFDIQKAVHLVPTNEIHNVSVTFMLYNEDNTWDTERYNYTLWKNLKCK